LCDTLPRRPWVLWMVSAVSQGILLPTGGLLCYALASWLQSWSPGSDCGQYSPKPARFGERHCTPGVRVGMAGWPTPNSKRPPQQRSRCRTEILQACRQPSKTLSSGQCSSVDSTNSQGADPLSRDESISSTSFSESHCMQSSRPST
jgi:hypothetical protein